MLKFSIITVTYNAAPLLKKTIESVTCQDNNEFEYIVIDGNSTDDTKEILNEYRDCISKVVSEPDKGIYDAMNKGIVMAEGDYCMFLNAGDELYDSTSLSRAASAITKHEGEIYLGLATYVYKDKDAVVFRPQINELPFTFCHQAMLFNTTILKNNLYDTKFRLSGDSELLYRLFENGRKFIVIDEMLVRELGGEGATERNLKASTKELYSIPYLRSNLSKCTIMLNKLKIALYCFLKEMHLNG